MKQQNDLEKGKLVCSKKRFYWTIFTAFLVIMCLFVVFGLLMHKMVEDMIDEAIAEVRIPVSNSVKYQAAVTLPPITTMLVKGRIDPSLKIQATIEEPPLLNHLVEPPIRAVESESSLLSEFPKEEEEEASPDYSIEYTSELYDESSYEYTGSGDYSSSSSSQSLTDDENLHGDDNSESYDDDYWY